MHTAGFVRVNTPPIEIEMRPMGRARLCGHEAEIQKLVLEINLLRSELNPKLELTAACLPDAHLVRELQERPFFDAWIKSILGTNMELDNLRAAEKELLSFRSTLQKILAVWKSTLDIHISLEEEMQIATEAKKGSVEEMFKVLTLAIEGDILSIFKKVGALFHLQKEKLDLLSQEHQSLVEKNVKLERQCHHLETTALEHTRTARELSLLLEEVKKIQTHSAQLEIERDEWQRACISQEKALRILTAEHTSLDGSFILASIDLKAQSKELQRVHEENHELQQAMIRLKETLDCQKDLSQSFEHKVAELAIAKDRERALKQTAFQMEKDFEVERCHYEAMIADERVKWRKEHSTRHSLEEELSQTRAKNSQSSEHNQFYLAFIQQLDSSLQATFKQQYECAFPPSEHLYNFGHLKKKLGFLATAK